MCTEDGRGHTLIDDSDKKECEIKDQECVLPPVGEQEHEEVRIPHGVVTADTHSDPRLPDPGPEIRPGVYA